MARFTVSVPDELKARLDAYADRHGLPVSQVVAQALESLLDSPPPGGAEALRLRQVEGYLARLSRHVEAVRLTVEDLAESSLVGRHVVRHPLPDALPAPPWTGEPV